MAIAFKCSSCQKRLKAKDEHGGRRITCPGCKTKVEVPAASEDALTDGEDAEPDDAPPPPRASKGDTVKRARLVENAPAKRKDDEEGGDDEGDAPLTLKKDGPSDEDDDGKGKKKKRRLGAGLAKKTGTARRARPAVASSGGGGSTFMSLFGARVVGGGILLLIGLVVSFFRGSAHYDSGYDKVQNGMSRAAVVELMGTPHETDNDDGPGCEALYYEAVDPTGRHTSKSTYYCIDLKDGKVVNKLRLTEDQVKALGGG
jgi:hypothetical protein